MSELGIGVSCSGRAYRSLPSFHLLPKPAPTKSGGVHKLQSTPVPPTHKHTCPLNTPPLTPEHTYDNYANWAAPFVNFSWNVSFHWGPGILAFVVDGKDMGMNPRTAFLTEPSPCVCTSPYSYLLAGLAHLLGFPFRDAHLAFS